MNEKDSNSDSFNLLIYLEVILKRKRLILIITTGFFIISIIISLAMPNIYSATTKILPPQQDAGLMNTLMGSMGGMGVLAGDLLGKASPADMYVSILSSDAISDTIIDRFKLMKLYDQKYRLDAYNTLSKNVDITAGKKDGIISITVEDKNPKLAADMANAYVEELSRLTVSLNMTGAVQNRSFYESNLTKAKAELAQSEDRLKMFQSKHKALDIMDQAKVTIEGVAQLQAQLAVQEVQLETLRRQYTDSSQEVKTLKTSIINIKSQITRLEGNSGGSAIPSVGSVPALSQEYIRLMRKFKMQEAIFEFLTKQYEMSKLSETNDVSTTQIIQKARIPDKKSKPKRVLIISLSTLLGMFLSMILVFILEYVENLTGQERETLQRLSNIFSAKKQF